MRTSFLRTHLDIWIPLPTFRHTETFCHLLTCCPHSPPGLKIRTCTNVTPVTHLQTQTYKFEIYSADNWLFRHCQSKGRLKHLPAHIPCSRICNFLPSDTKPEMQFAQQPASRWIYFNFLLGFVEMFLQDLQTHAQQFAEVIFTRISLSTIGDQQN